MLEPEVRAKSINLRRGISLRIPLMNDLIEESELGLCRSDSLKISRANGADHVVAREARLMNAESSPLTTSLSSSSSDRGASCGSNSKTFRPIKRYAPGSDAPAPEYLARSLLQLGCPAVSMPTPRGGVGSEQPPSSDSDDYTTAHRQGAGGYGQNLDVYTVPKVQVSGPSNANESASVINGHLSKPLSRSTPSMAAGGAQTPAKVSSRSSSRSSPTSTSSARQKKFHRHFAQVAEDEHVLNYYSCALVGDILLQGHLYITPNYFAFYSNVFGYVTKLLIPTASVLKISKEKTARIIPNAVAVATEEERHVFCSLLSRDSTYKLMKQVWDAALEPRTIPDAVLPDNDTKLIAPEAMLVSEENIVESSHESSASESGTDATATTSSRPITCVDNTEIAPVVLNRPSLPPARFETVVLTKTLVPARSGRLQFLFANGVKPGMVIAILMALLAVLYVSAALMMMRIDKLHTAYLNHPFVSPERFTQDRLLHYLNTNLDQIVKVRQSLQTLSQQFVTMSQGGSETGPAGGVVEPEDAPS
ncbi:cyclic GMP-binding protein C isoform X3 [Camponotus floridanus]|uniref:cyclic GMP-binding protein C isoform X3 n=1 Tax=Camponotus floridanus TaxID=104421 RepID=UPI000DC690BC|nr:cyclic GMP-binding protein C isoform X3 [Camponotus floridanus]